jgi:hypothetical protein
MAPLPSLGEVPPALGQTAARRTPEGPDCSRARRELLGLRRSQGLEAPEPRGHRGRPLPLRRRRHRSLTYRHAIVAEPPNPDGGQTAGSPCGAGSRCAHSGLAFRPWTRCDRLTWHPTSGSPSSASHGSAQNKDSPNRGTYSMVRESGERTWSCAGPRGAGGVRSRGESGHAPDVI